MKEKLTAIHNQALQILETVGVRLHHAELLEQLQQHGVSVKGNTAFFAPDFIMSALRRAPASFTLHARNPRCDMVIGGDHINCAPGYGYAAIYAPDGTRRNALMADYVRLAKLVHQCSHFNINGGILAQPSDVPADQSHLLMLYAAMVSSDKCLMGIPGNRMQLQALMDLDVSRETLNMELIRRVGPGGQFLTARDTLQKCRSHSWNPVVGVRGITGGGSPADQFLNRIDDRQQAMLASYSPPTMHRALLADLDDCMVRQGVDRSLLTTICSQVWGNSNH